MHLLLESIQYIEGIFSKFSSHNSPISYSAISFWLVNKNVFLKKWAIPGLFFICFRLFKQTLQFVQQINVNKCPSSIRCWDSWDSNPRPLEHESPPITTRPGQSIKVLSFTRFCLLLGKEPHT